MRVSGHRISIAAVQAGVCGKLRFYRPPASSAPPRHLTLRCITGRTTTPAITGRRTRVPQRKRARRAIDKKTEKAEKETGAKPVGPLIIAISIEKQRVRVYDANGFFAESPVSTGTKTHPTPMGVFSIIQKHKMHHSNIYSGAPMPFMQRITWSGVAMHAGVLPGYPASHGCIRMPMAFAQKMWNWTKMGARVVVTPGEMTPAQFLASLAGHAEGGAGRQRRAAGRRAARRQVRQGRRRQADGQADRYRRDDPRTAIERRSCAVDPDRRRQRRDAGQCRRHDVRCFSRGCLRRGRFGESPGDCRDGGQARSRESRRSKTGNGKIGNRTGARQEHGHRRSPKKSRPKS